MISVPALFVLLTIACSLANYLAVINAGSRLTAAGVPANVLADLQSQLLDFLLIFSFLALVGGMVLAWTILRPIRRMAEAVDHIVKGNILERSVQVSAGFELDQLGQGFNSIIKFLQETINERSDLLAESIIAGAMLVDQRGRILSINARGVEILGVEREDLVGRTLSQVRQALPDIAPVFINFCEETLRTHIVGGGEDISLGARFVGEKPLTVSCSLLEENGARKAIFHFRDLSRIQSLNRLFSRTDQLAALGTFTMGLSHELRNPLAAIKGTAQLMTEIPTAQQVFGPYLERIVQETDRLDKLVRELYDFSTSPAGGKTSHDLNEIARETLADVVRGISPEHRETRLIQENYGTQLPQVVLQRDRIGRAIGNILINAFEQTPEGGTICLKTQLLSDIKPPRVALEIMNTGSTIEGENLGRIFEPFFSTKTHGLGLGLAIAYQIAVQNSCLLSATSDPQSVTFQFAFRFPEPISNGVAEDEAGTGTNDSARK